jgi:transcriptional regulator with XRE-family HTH domain
MADRLSQRAAVARNVAIMRTIRRLTQRDVAARMTELGFDWRQQTVARVESSQRPVTTEELWGLAETLGAGFPGLLTAREPNVPPDPKLTIELPSGTPVNVEDYEELIHGQVRGHITWDGVTPSFQPGGWQPARDSSKPQGWSGPIGDASRSVGSHERTP